MSEYLRVFKPFDLAEVQQHMLILGDLVGDCASCRALGIEPYSTTVCPECGTPFKYVTSRRLESHSGERFHLAKRMAEKRPDLIFIDYTDFSKAVGQKKARDFFG